MNARNYYTGPRQNTAYCHLLEIQILAYALANDIVIPTDVADVGRRIEELGNQLYKHSNL